MLKRVSSLVLILSVVIGGGQVALAADECSSDWECPGWVECIQGKCHIVPQSVQICEPGADAGGGCPEGCNCVYGDCVCDTPSLIGCATGADCTEFEDCVKGGCVGHDGGQVNGSCDAVDECSEKKVCAYHRCEDKMDYCIADDGCDQFETCELECVLYEYGAGGSFDGATCLLELGKCDFDIAKVELKPECDPFCDKLGPCWESEQNDENSGKADTITDGSDMVLECKYVCSVFLADPASQVSMEAAIACLEIAEGECAEVGVTCESELDATFGAETTGGGLDVNAPAGDVITDDLSPEVADSKGNDSGACTTSAHASASQTGTFLLLIAALMLVLLRQRKASL